MRLKEERNRNEWTAHLVQPPGLKNGASTEVPKLQLLKWSLAPKVNQSPEPHPKMSKSTAEINISIACTGEKKKKRERDTYGYFSPSRHEVKKKIYIKLDET